MKKHTFGRGLASVLISVVAVAPFAGLVVPSVVSAASPFGGCTSENSTLYTVAHQDDSILFQSPDLLHDIQSGNCTLTVFVTAGDAGDIPSYWMEREVGVEAAYADMAGVASNWQESDAGIPGHPIRTVTLIGKPTVSLMFLRLPDGGVDGEGFWSGQSLKKLWENTLPAMNVVDGSGSYARQQLIDVLVAIMASHQPSRILTQNFTGTFGDGDHSDHLSTAFFTKAAHELYPTPHTISSYLGYTALMHDENVTGADLAAKEASFFAYAPHDPHVCQTHDECAGPFAGWINRQYVSAILSGGIPDACPNLDGLQTTVPNGYQLDGGQCVPKPAICQSVVSDTTDTTAPGVPAVATFVPTTWTAGPNIPGATWIWDSFHVADPINGGNVTFTKEINVDGTVTGTTTAASIVIASDDNYSASLNGAVFGGSDAVNNYSAGNEDVYNVFPQLQTGLNTLIITVYNLATGDSNPEVNPAGLRYKLDIEKESCTTPTPPPPPVEPPATTTPPTEPPTGGTGSGTYVPPELQISNRALVVRKNSREVEVKWTTSRPAFGHVIYGPVAGGPYTLDLSAPNFGYPMSVPSDPSDEGHLEGTVEKVLDHSFVIPGLTPGAKYRYRIVSHASPSVTTEEDTFTIPEDEAATTTEVALNTEPAKSAAKPKPTVKGAVVAQNNPNTDVQAEVKSTDESASTTAAVASTDTNGTGWNKNLAAAFGSLALLSDTPMAQWGLLALLVLVLAFVVWHFQRRQEHA